MNKPLFFGLLCLTVASGCSFIPNLPSAQPPIPENWQEVKNLHPTTDPLALPVATNSATLPWRQFYQHPLWQEVIDSALRNNRDLQATVARMAKSKALLGITDAARLPSLQGNLLHQESRTPAELAQSGKATRSTREDLQLAIPAFELDFWGRIHSLRESAKATYLANLETVQAVHILLIAQVAEALLLWREAAERSTLAQQQVALQQELLELMTERQKVGLATAQSQLQAVTAWENAKVEWAEWQRQEGEAHHHLQLLSGHNWDPDRHWPLLEELILSDTLPEGVPALVLASRPDVRAAEYRLQAANADIGAVRAAFWPQISLTGSLGVASKGLQGLFQAGATTWSFLPSIEIPIFSAGRHQFAQEAAEAEQAALLAEYEKIVQQAFREVADGLQARKVLADKVAAQKSSYHAQWARQQLLLERWQAGVDSKQELLHQQLLVSEQAQQLRSVERQLLRNQVMLYKALAGGSTPTLSHSSP
ncbi:efflux transporter outer membrane subunit [Candidatus Magnetaquicoccus inordinatus]|uniref:efflux transporter outer membrane subunit n=1 Tax=Candidatus Magnetaquicoccus inordinatus TaxID=2496818 RepID=UPI00102B0790|nr:efflux transporter outer membrane subunit [Candidatus Magnetaquicoccus inordinatus]